MLKKKLPFVIYFVGLLLLVIVAASWFFLRIFTYDALVTSILHEIQREDLRPLLTTKYFTLSKFALLQKISLILSVISCILLVFYVRGRKKIIFFMARCVDICYLQLQCIIKDVTSSSKRGLVLLGVLLLIILLRSIVLCNTYALQYDEVWNYNYFLSKNIFYSCLAYNNYPLHNIITACLLKFLPVSAFTIRLSIILFGLFTCLAVFIVAKRLFNKEWLALCAVLLFACLPVSVYYMLYARGVMVNLFFLICIFYCLTKLAEKKLRFWQILCVSFLNALATYSILSHVYFIVFSCVSLFFYTIYSKKYNLVLQVFYYGLFSCLFTGILLIPILVGTGISFGVSASVANASYLALHHLPLHCYADFYGGWWFSFYILLSINIILFFLTSAKKYKFIVVSNIVFVASIFIIKYTTHIYPPERALTYLTIVPLSTIMLLGNLLRKNLTVCLTFFLSVVSFYQAYTGDYLNWSKNLDFRVKQLSEVLIKKDIETLYNDSPDFFYFVPGLIYYYSLNNKQLNYYTSTKESTRYKPILEVDSIDCIVVSDSILSFPIIFKEDKSTIYLLK